MLSRVSTTRRDNGPTRRGVPEGRLRPGNAADVRPDGEHVLYWMTAFRRLGSNFALDRALEWCHELGRPLLILEALRCGYTWAADRHHRFVLDGMRDNARAAAKAGPGVLYYPYVEPAPGRGKGLLLELARRACVVVGDDCPSFFLPRMTAAAGAQLPVRLELVDSNGLLPLRATDRVFSRAFDFRRFLQRTLALHLLERPHATPLVRAGLPPCPAVSARVRQRWPQADDRLLSGELDLGALPIDHGVPPVPDAAGGPRAGAARLASFLDDDLSRYLEDRNHPDRHATSRLSPYLHFGHVSSHQVLEALAAREQWEPTRLLDGPRKGAREGWWRLSPPAEAFMDQLVTWRELGFNLSWQRPDCAEYDSLPDWARRTLAEHEDDPRDPVYSLAQLEAATTYDPIWNAAQRELVRDGRIHNYLRMLWGKKILEWSKTPRAALAAMLALNDKYALDGRDPNSISGITWCLGRYDRAWGPVRPIFGKIRYMSSDATRRKTNLKGYLARYGDSS
jgi:deoxyribodipyrimidine photo-lyase